MASSMVCWRAGRSLAPSRRIARRWVRRSYKSGKERVFTCMAANSIARGRRSMRSQIAATCCGAYTPPWSYCQRSLLKECHCLCKRKRSQRKDLFSAQAQGHAARHQNREARAVGEQICHRGGRFQNLLEIVKDQEKVFPL